MFNTKTMVEGALLTALAAVFQLIPVYFSEIFIFFTLFSTFPIYFLTRKNILVGLLSYIACGFIVFMFSVHESIIFVFLNGLIGVSLGYIEHFLRNKLILNILVGFLLTLSICVVNFLIGIPLFGRQFHFSIFVLLTMMIFSFIYVFLYYYISQFLIKRLSINQSEID